MGQAKASAGPQFAVGILGTIVQRMTLEEPALGYEFLEKAVMSLPERISVIRLEKSDLGWLYLKAWDAAKNGFRKPLDLFNSKLGSFAEKSLPDLPYKPF